MPAAHKTTTVIEPRRTILVFQGGGALGAYQAGVFEALVESGRQPDWVVGTSIGAINGALIAGNPPEHEYVAAARRLRHLERNRPCMSSRWPPALATGGHQRAALA